VVLYSAFFVAFHSALFGLPLAYEYKSTCLLVQKYLLTTTERAACSYKTRSMLDEMTVYSCPHLSGRVMLVQGPRRLFMSHSRSLASAVSHDILESTPASTSRVPAFPFLHSRGGRSESEFPVRARSILESLGTSGSESAVRSNT
jgi:hypothetical protein